MLIFEAKTIVDSVIKHLNEEGDEELKEALEIASKSLERQEELADTLNDWDINTEIERGEKYSAQGCYDIVRQFSIYVEDEDD